MEAMARNGGSSLVKIGIMSPDLVTYGARPKGEQGINTTEKKVYMEDEPKIGAGMCPGGTVENYAAMEFEARIYDKNAGSGQYTIDFTGGLVPAGPPIGIPKFTWEFNIRMIPTPLGFTTIPDAQDWDALLDAP
jgi:hypothetical protein